MGTLTCHTCGIVKDAEGPWDTTTVYCSDCDSKSKSFRNVGRYGTITTVTLKLGENSAWVESTTEIADFNRVWWREPSATEQRSYVDALLKPLKLKRSGARWEVRNDPSHRTVTGVVWRYEVVPADVAPEV